MTGMARRPRLAVFIDGENVSARYAKPLFCKISVLGDATLRRVYGDFSGSAPQGWKHDILSAHGLLAQQVFASNIGKNATDIALVIDAMDALQGDAIDGMVLVSTDGDFTRLALWLREGGLSVYGIGMSHAPEALVKACTKFFVLEHLEHDALSSEPSSHMPVKQEGMIRPDPVKLILNALKKAKAGDGWCDLRQIGQHIRNSAPDFDPRHYGKPRLSTLAESLGQVAIKRGPGNLVYIRRA